MARSQSLDGLGVFEGVVHGLCGMRNALRDAPAIVIVAKSDGGGVAQVGGVERGADFVQRDPLPGEVDIGLSSVFADSGNF